MNRNAERLRTSIHLAVAPVPLAAWWLMGEWPTAVRVILALGALLAVVLDGARHRHAGWKHWIEGPIGPLLRPHEREGLLASTFIPVSMAVLFLLLPRSLALAAMLFLLVGDAVAALVGRRIGRLRINRWATLEGGLAGLLASLALVPLVHALDPAVRPGVLMAGAAAAAVTEVLTPGRFDNLAVPLVAGAVMGALSPGN